MFLIINRLFFISFCFFVWCVNGSLFQFQCAACSWSMKKNHLRSNSNLSTRRFSHNVCRDLAEVVSCLGKCHRLLFNLISEPVCYSRVISVLRWYKNCVCTWLRSLCSVVVGKLSWQSHLRVASNRYRYSQITVLHRLCVQRICPSGGSIRLTIQHTASH